MSSEKVVDSPQGYVWKFGFRMRGMSILFVKSFRGKYWKETTFKNIKKEYVVYGLFLNMVISITLFPSSSVYLYNNLFVTKFENMFNLNLR